MKNLTGQRFGRLSVIQSTPERKDGRIVWLCKCDCGVVFAGSSTLHNGYTRSCGCLKEEQDA